MKIWQKLVTAVDWLHANHINGTITDVRESGFAYMVANGNEYFVPWLELEAKDVTN